MVSEGEKVFNEIMIWVWDLLFNIVVLNIVKEVYVKDYFDVKINVVEYV